MSKQSMYRSALILLFVSLVSARQSSSQVVPLHRPPTTPAEVQRRNQEIVLTFIDRFFEHHDMTAVGEMMREDYIQHNPIVGNGRQAFIDKFKDLFAQFPHSHTTVIRVATSGDLVWLQHHQQNDANDPGRAIMDIYRVQDGKLAEHWDAITLVSTTPANKNSQF